MKFSRTVMAIDSHTMGEPTRIVVGGIPNIPGKTMADKKEYLEQHMDYIRTALMREPRGHRDMFGSILTSSVNPEADYGIVFMSNARPTARNRKTSSSSSAWARATSRWGGRTARVSAA